MIPGIVGPDTRDICYAVQNRQNALRSLSQCVDLMLVVGAANSANTVTLHTLADETGVPAYRVADGSELDRQWFRDIETVGITAGASTPEALVDDVIAALAKLAPLTIKTLPGREEQVRFNLPNGLIARGC